MGCGSVDAPPPRDLGQEIGTILGQGQNIVNASASLTPQFTSIQLANLDALLNGTTATTNTTSGTRAASQAGWYGAQGNYLGSSFAASDPSSYPTLANGRINWGAVMNSPGGLFSGTPGGSAPAGAVWRKAGEKFTGMSTTTTPGQTGLLGQYTNNILPALTDANNAANTSTRKATLGDLTTLGPGYSAAIRNLDPGVAGLSKTLDEQAAQGLAAGDQLLPGDRARITSNVRSDWANRGLGTSPVAALDEAVNLATSGEDVLKRRQDFAGQVAGQDYSMFSSPVLAEMGITGPSGQAGGFLSTAQAGAQPFNVFGEIGGYASDLFNTNYNANAAAGIASANNSAALYSSLVPNC